MAWRDYSLEGEFLERGGPGGLVDYIGVMGHKALEGGTGTAGGRSSVPCTTTSHLMAYIICGRVLNWKIIHVV